MSEKQSINFLRGVPAEEALSHLIPMAAEGYEKAVRRYGTDVLQYGHFPRLEQVSRVVLSDH